jgi:hypothetical protein
MRVDDKPVFTVCGSRSSRSEVTLFDSPFDDGRGIHIMSVLKAAKIMKIELKVDNGKNQIFTFKPDKPLDRKW